jgi:predicted nucleic-acid-binding protein
MVLLIDANILVRFFACDHKTLTPKAQEILMQVEQDTIEVEILPSVLMETIFVLTKLYEHDKRELIEDLKKVIAYKGVRGEKAILLETLNSMLKYNIDFVDALICTKCNFQGYGVLSFDKDIQKCYKVDTL